MQSLLRWGVENSSAGAPPPVPRKDLDPGIIDHILGKSDAQLMKEALGVAVNESQIEDDRLRALEDLEMLVQNIDNANGNSFLFDVFRSNTYDIDMKKLNMWEPLHGLLLASSTSDDIKMQTLWVIGTALQNNPAAQLTYLELEPLPVLLRSLSPLDSSATTRSRAMYTLSGLLKLNAAAVKQMSAVGGWSALRTSLEDSDIRVRRKTVFLLDSLLMPTSDESVILQSNINAPSSANSPVHPNSHASMISNPSSISTWSVTLAALQSESAPEGSSLLDALVSALTEPLPFGPDGENDKDVEFQELIVRQVSLYIANVFRTLTTLQGCTLSPIRRLSDKAIYLADQFAIKRHLKSLTYGIDALIMWWDLKGTEENKSVVGSIEGEALCFCPQRSSLSLEHDHEADDNLGLALGSVRLYRYLMTSLDLHHKLFASESDEHVSTLKPMSRILSLTTVQEPSSPTTALTFNSPAYLDLLSRQPLHPDGPRHWDLGLDLTGDPATAAECKSLEDHTTKAKLRRLQTICMVFEVVLGIWSTYCTVRYFLAFNTTSISSVRTLALVLFVTSAIAIVGVVVALFVPLLPEDVFVRASPHARMTLRGCYIVLIAATAIVNLVFVLLWRPTDRCSWDMDVSWSASPTIHSTSPQCHNTSLAAWTITASLRVIVTLIIVLVYLYFLRVYFATKHPSKCTRQMYYPPSVALDEEADSPISSPSTSMTHFNFPRSKTAFERSRSSFTLALTNSSTTLTPTLSLSSQSHSHSSMRVNKSHDPMAPSARHSLPICPNWTSFPAAEVDPPADHQRPHGRSKTPRTLRGKGRISSEYILRDPDATVAWEECTEVHTVVPGVSRVVSRTVDNIPSVAEHRDECLTPGCRTCSTASLDRVTQLGDCSSVDSYGYGASEPAYPYLDVYNPSIDRRQNLASAANMAQPPRLSVTFIPDTGDTVEYTMTVEDDDMVEDELIPIMGGFVRRMATIESFGSREAATSMTRSRLSRFSETPASLNSSLRFATCTPSITSTVSKNDSLGTAYFSVSSGVESSEATAVNERGELEAKTSRITSPPSYDRYYYTRD
ncbi:hypothetical protein AZE42_05607 [Rhizopogon vesiculosus]|uniref:Nucleotide exchange factor Fes1 domain-containing protein n=1 Tax=Rhizopogon vesiculosus TaxID=180088 RepID=A0A1J8QIF6_9AGAM|nr:hypothetical protein AZE42_05607 [Rhizopogon vesiculosus]